MQPLPQQAEFNAKQLLSSIFRGTSSLSHSQCCPHDSKCQQYVFPPQPLLRPAILGVLMRKEAVQAKRI